MATTPEVKRFRPEDYPGAMFIPIDQVFDNPHQYRSTMDMIEVEKIAESIFLNGLQQPPRARAVAGGVQIAFGHKRKAAVKILVESGRMAGGMPLYIVEMTDDEMFYNAHAEHEGRSDPSPMDRIRSFQRGLERLKITAQELARRLNVDQ